MDPNTRTPDKGNSGDKKPKSNKLLALLIAVAVVFVLSGIYNAISNSRFTL